MSADVTPALALALEAARAYARQQGAAEVLPGQLLYALLKEEEGRAATVLVRAGVSLAKISRPPVAATAGPAAPDLPVVFGPRVQDILAGAALFAREFSEDRATTTDQALLALLEREPGLRADLEAAGLEMARLEGQVKTAPGPFLLEEPLYLAELVEKVETARILDACGNRAREGLRVREDYCRFVLDDAFLTGELKRLRHDLTAVLSELPGGLLLEARDTVHDVGTDLTTAGEQERFSLREVAQANLKRLQEALRSLEEFGKLESPALGRALEQLRYRSYTLEQTLLLGARARDRLAEARLYILITGSQCLASIDWTIQEAAAGGAQIVQLREKNLADRDLLDRARKVRQWTRRAGVLFIMNDRADLARLAQADGVHLGQDDLPLAEARRILGPDVLIGVSTHHIDQVRQAVLGGASYIGVGPTFPSGTKSFAKFPGLDFVRQAAAETTLPAFVIGGVTPDTLAPILAAGGRRVAVSRAICRADDPQAVVRQFRLALDDAWNRR